MSVMLAATLRSRGTPAVHVFADTVIATDDRFGNARPDRDRTREQADGTRPAASRRRQDGGHDRLHRRRARWPHDHARPRRLRLQRDPPRRGARCRRSSDLDRCAGRALRRSAPGARCARRSRASATTRRRSWPISARRCSTRAPSAPRSRSISRSASSRHLRPTSRARWSSARHPTTQIKAVTAMKGLMMLTIDVPELEDLAGAAAAVFGALHDDRVEIVPRRQASSRRRMTYLVDAAVGRRLRDDCRERIETRSTTSRRRSAATRMSPWSPPSARARPTSRPRSARCGASCAGPGFRCSASSQQTSNVALVVVVPAHAREQAVEAVHDAFIGPQPASAGSAPAPHRMQRESLRVG